MTYKLDAAKVLIVEDMVPMQMLLKSLLGIYGFRDVYTASGGEEAFSIFCQLKPDLVITDWIMDDGDGLSLVRKIRKDRKSPNSFVPILIVTGFNSRERVVSARDSGVTEFLIKPFTAAELFAKIERIIEKPRQFIENEEFFGPDRRRKRGDAYQGPQRRGDEVRKKPLEKTPSGKSSHEVFRELVAKARETQANEEKKS